MDTDRQVRQGMKLSAWHHHQLRRVLPELRSGYLDRLAFVSGPEASRIRFTVPSVGITINQATFLTVAHPHRDRS
jgi:hypothetical protein